MHSQNIISSARIVFIIIPIMLFFNGMAEPPVKELRQNFPYAELSDTLIDLGNIEKDARAMGTITIHNTGSKPLLIATVRSSCGLMTPSWPTQPVEAGQKVSITFRYDAGSIGPFERIITIHTNAYQKTLRVRVKGNVMPAAPQMPE